MGELNLRKGPIKLQVRRLYEKTLLRRRLFTLQGLWVFYAGNTNSLPSFLCPLIGLPKIFLFSSSHKITVTHNWTLAGRDWVFILRPLNVSPNLAGLKYSSISPVSFLSNSLSFEFQLTLQIISISVTALRPMLAAVMMSSCWQEFPAATALAVAKVTSLVLLIRSSGVASRTGREGFWMT